MLDSRMVFRSGVPGLVATDVDGTLVTSQHQVTERSYRAVQLLDGRGIPLVLATGRPIRWLPSVLLPLPVRPLCICLNGAVILDSYHEQVLRRTVLKPSSVGEIVHEVQRLLPEACFGVERVTSELLPSNGCGPGEQFLVAESYMNCWYEQRASRTTVQGLAEEPAAKVLIRVPDMASKDIADEIRDVVEPIANVTFSVEKGLVECSHPAATKGEALARILDYCDLSEEALLSFGDMPNDIDMLELSAWGVAMDNAHPEVKRVADEVTGSCDDDGVAQVLERFLGSV